MREDLNASTDWELFTTRLFDQSRFAIKLGLENIQRALEAEGNPQLGWKTITVGGTNGKGQTASFLSNIVQEHGYKVGLFTSPHLIEFRERYRVNGVPVSRELVLEIGRYVLEKYSSGEIQLTFFEMCVLIGVLVFKKLGVQVAVMEVGLGGRLDAVNAIEPSLVVITNIGLDHEAYLGNTIEEVAAEKFALIRPGLPTVISPQRFPHVLDRLNSSFELIEEQKSFRLNNMATAFRAAELFFGDEVIVEKVDRAIAISHWPGRAERVSLKGPKGNAFDVIVDAAHNPLGLESFLQSYDLDDFDVIIFGAMADKDLKRMGELLEKIEKEIWGVEVNSARAADENELRKWIPLSRFGRLDAFLEEEPRALICGSIYLLGEVFVWGGLGVDDLLIRRPSQS